MIPLLLAGEAEAPFTGMDDPSLLMRRGMQIGIASALLFLLTAALFRRWDWLLGLLLGSGLSLFNFRLLGRSATRWLQGEGTPRIAEIGKGLLLRLLFSGICLAIAILYLPLNLLGLIVGLFAAQGGLLAGYFLPINRAKKETGDK